MAIPTFVITPMGRRQGRNAVAAAAYRSGSELTDVRTGVVHDYTKKQGVVHTEIVALDGITPPDREQLWNAAESAETRKDGRIAREYLIALPHELDASQRVELTREVAREIVERYGVAVDIAIHTPDRGGDQRNHHAHLLATTRQLNHDGLGEKADIELSDKKRKSMGMGPGDAEVTLLRQRWQGLANAALEKAGVDARIDTRSLKDQGIDRLPQIHVGNHGTQMIRKGTPEQSDRATTNLAIIETNDEISQLREQLAIERFENAEGHIEQRHQLQIRAELRQLYATQQRLDAEREAAEQREWDEWISRPDVDPTTGRIITEWAVDACIERERELPENQPPANAIAPSESDIWEPHRAKPKPSPAPPAREKPTKPPQAVPQRASEPVEPKPEPAPQAPVFDARARALEIVKMGTAGERHAAFRAAFELPDDDYDALDIKLEPLMSGLTGELTEEGKRLRAELVPQDSGPFERAERVQSEPFSEPPGSPGGPGF